jgi:hypothetical protein
VRVTRGVMQKAQKNLCVRGAHSAVREAAPDGNQIRGRIEPPHALSNAREWLLEPADCFRDFPRIVGRRLKERQGEREAWPTELAIPSETPFRFANIFKGGGARQTKETVRIVFYGRKPKRRTIQAIGFRRDERLEVRADPFDTNISDLAPALSGIRSHE